MPTPTDTPIEQFRRGDRPGAGRFNEIVDQLNAVTRAVASLQGDKPAEARTPYALIAIDSAATGSTKTRFKGKRLRVRANRVPPAEVAAVDYGIIPAQADCEVWVAPDGANLVAGVYLGTKSDGTPIFLVDRAIRKERFANDKIQVAFIPNPTDAQYEDAITTEACNTGARTGTASGSSRFNINGLDSRGPMFDGGTQLNLSTPLRTTVRITTGNTATDGTGATELIEFGGNGGTLYKLVAAAVGPVNSTNVIRFFHQPTGSGDKFWMPDKDIHVESQNAQSSETPWVGQWIDPDPANGEMFGVGDKIYVVAYGDGDFNVTAVAANVT